MRVGVISDTHGQIDRVVEKLDELDIDLLLHLGDHSEDGVKIGGKLKKEVIIVRGNCDFYDGVNPLERIIEIEGRKIFMTHGHKYNIKKDIRNLYYRGKELEVDIVLFGHTHISYLFQEDNIKIFNPGSPTLPRGNSGASIGVINFGQDTIDFEIIGL